MAIKVFRFFLGGYAPNSAEMLERKVYAFRLPKPLITVSNPTDGFARVKGLIKKQGVVYSDASVCLFSRGNRNLIWETKSKKDGTYQFRNIKVGLDCFVIAFDSNNQYNAVIQDEVIAK